MTGGAIKMLIFLQSDNDPHHMHPDFSYVYYFVILALIFLAATLFAARKIMIYLDNRYERRKSNDENSGGTIEHDRDENQKN